MDRSGLPDLVEEGLNLDVDEFYEDVRAAAHILVTLGRVYVYPVDKLDAHLALAIQRLQRILNDGVYDEVPGIVAAIEAEIATLKSRQKGAPGR